MPNYLKAYDKRWWKRCQREVYPRREKIPRLTYMDRQLANALADRFNEMGPEEYWKWLWG